MWATRWIVEGAVASALALAVAYFVLEPAPSVLAYGSLLGWSGIVCVLVVIIQGFRNIAKPSSPEVGQSGSAHYEFAVNRWGGIHIALSIAVTVLVVLHGLLFWGGLWVFSFPVWLGAMAFIVLVVLNLSGLFTESKRKSRRFGSLKNVHVLLMAVVLVLVLAHIELIAEAWYARSIVEGAVVAFVVVFVVLVSVPFTIHT